MPGHNLWFKIWFIIPNILQNLEFLHSDSSFIGYIISQKIESINLFQCHIINTHHACNCFVALYSDMWIVCFWRDHLKLM
jgi:hypothetical protein